MRAAIFFPRVILYNFFLFWLIYGSLGFGVLGLGPYIGFLGFGFLVDGVWGPWCWDFWVFWLGALYINSKEWQRITLEKNGATLPGSLHCE